MINITGGMGNLATCIADELISRNLDFVLHGRKTCLPKYNAYYNKLIDYEDIVFKKTSRILVVTNGFFQYVKFEKTSNQEITDLIRANYDVVVRLVWNFLKQTDASLRRDIFVMGSTAAYDLGPNAGLYGASKLALRGLLESLNREYSNQDTRFSLISFSTINNEMGSLVPDQDPSTLLESDSIAKEICDRVMRDSNYYEPEIIFRRRFIQRHKL